MAREADRATALSGTGGWSLTHWPRQASLPLPWAASAHLPAGPPLPALGSRGLPPHVDETFPGSCGTGAGARVGQNLWLQQSLGPGSVPGEAPGLPAPAGSTSPTGSPVAQMCTGLPAPSCWAPSGSRDAQLSHFLIVGPWTCILPSLGVIFLPEELGQRTSMTTFHGDFRVQGSLRHGYDTVPALR